MKFDLIGAFDRHNYGDILFPWVHNEFLKAQGIPEQNIEFYSLREADLRDVNGFKTKSLKKLPGCAIDGELRRRILVGGEILAVDWVAMSANSLPFAFKYPLYGARKILGHRLTNSLVARCFNQDRLLPYVIDSAPGCETYYCSVGGTALGKKRHSHTKDYVAHVLASAAFVSVRDIETRAALSEVGVDADLTPDVAALMAEFMTLDALKATEPFSHCRKTHHFDPENYFAFQVGRGHGAGSEDEIAQELLDLVNATGKSALLVPIGCASGHEDHIILRDIFERLQGLIPLGLLESKSVFHIMASIALSKGYIGTSLHGAITAFSFERPVCGTRGEVVRKLASYIETWFPKECATSMTGFKFAHYFESLVRNYDRTAAAISGRDQRDRVRALLLSYVHGP